MEYRQLDQGNHLLFNSSPELKIETLPDANPEDLAEAQIREATDLAPARPEALL
jgi:hypothetical protein